jgi:hypothetical protein
MAVWGLNPELLGSLWLMASATWGGEITSAEGLHDWGRRAVPLFLLYTGICLTTEDKHGKKCITLKSNQRPCGSEPSVLPTELVVFYIES